MVIGRAALLALGPVRGGVVLAETELDMGMDAVVDIHLSAAIVMPTESSADVEVSNLESFCCCHLSP